VNFREAVSELDARVPTRMVPDLKRIQALMELLAHPERAIPSIHITGTNGKTTTAMVATEVLRAAGLNTGTYTSPHLASPAERIALDGAPISDQLFADTLEYLTPLLERVDALGERVTWFETATAMAFTAFSDHAVDAAVIEVGMGGEWDATNVIDAPVAVITEVAVDHPELGSTPVEVAREKVGIIKDGAVVLTAERDPGVLAVIEERCKERGAELRIAGDAFALLDRRTGFGGQEISIRLRERVYSELLLPLFGSRLAEDALLGVAAASAFLGDRDLDDDVLLEALPKVRSPGRLEVVRRRPLVVLDGAHNPDAAEFLAGALRESFAWERLWLVVSILGDKDVAGVLARLATVANEAIVTRNESPRAAPIDRVVEELEALGVPHRSAPTVEDALQLALEHASETDCVCVTGSLYTVGQARTLLLPPRREDFS
jgi:dihydrofolate synthase / folylpolyglutamate synthase